jgi:hypothetical protein
MAIIAIKPTKKGTQSIWINGRKCGELVQLFAGFFVPELTRRVSSAEEAGIRCYMEMLNN